MISIENYVVFLTFLNHNITYKVNVVLHLFTSWKYFLCFLAIYFSKFPDICFQGYTFQMLIE